MELTKFIWCKNTLKSTHSRVFPQIRIPLAFQRPLACLYVLGFPGRYKEKNVGAVHGWGKEKECMWLAPSCLFSVTHYLSYEQLTHLLIDCVLMASLLRSRIVPEYGISSKYENGKGVGLNHISVWIVQAMQIPGYDLTAVSMGGLAKMLILEKPGNQ